MAGRPKLDVEKHPLAEFLPGFSEHLRRSDRTASTQGATVYYVRRGLAALPDHVTVSAQTDFIDTIPPRQRSPYRSAWRAFGEYVNSVSPGTVELLPLGYGGRPVARVTPRDGLIHALHATDPKTLTFEVISELRWRSVRFTMEGGMILIPAAYALAVSRAYLDRVAAEGHPYSVPPLPEGAPLFPAEPEGLEPLSPWRVEQAVRRARTALDERKIAPWRVPPNLLRLKL